MWRAVLILVCLSGLAQERPEYRVDKVLAKLSFASGTVWSKEGYLLVSDLPAGTLTKLDSHGPSVFGEKLHAAGLATDAEGRIWACDPRERRVVRLDKKGSKLEVMADRIGGKRFNGPNALVISRNGAAWFTDAAFGSATASNELDYPAIYHLSSKGEVTLAAKLAGRAAGLALSPDGKTLYATDADNRSVLAWDVDKSTLSGSPRTVARMRKGVPNGIVAGADGLLYVACRNVEIYSPSGEYKGAIELSEKPADMAFGDGDMNSLYVCARTSLFRVRFVSKGDKGH